MLTCNHSRRQYFIAVQQPTGQLLFEIEGFFRKLNINYAVLSKVNIRENCDFAIVSILIRNTQFDINIIGKISYHLLLIFDTKSFLFFVWNVLQLLTINCALKKIYCQFGNT